MKIVIKVGTSTIAHSTGRLNIRLMEKLCKTMSDLKNAGNELILVSSGAVGMGAGKLNLPERPKDIASKQAVAAVGQCELMYTYDKLFSEYNHTVAQILLTAADLRSPERHENFENTMERLLSMKVLPIINENDTVATDEIVIGDNDTLAAIVALSVKADLLVLLSDIDGLFTSNPKVDKNATLIPEVLEVTEETYAIAGGSSSNLGTGGMVTKLRAAEIATKGGCDMIIANGSDPEKLYKIAENESVGTRFYANGKR